MFIQEDLKDCADLKSAVELLESPSITAKISDAIGSPIEKVVKRLPESVAKKINGTVEAALHKAADAALWSLDNEPNKTSSTKLHKFYAATSGAVGGAFGFTALFIELPISTTIMMRSVADVARSEGFDLTDLSTKRTCIEVFALGGNTKSDDSTDTGYYASRGFVTQSMEVLSKELAKHTGKVNINIAPKFTHTQAGSLLAEVIQKVAARFGIVITNKFAAQAVPIIGAGAGATLNVLFTDYYQKMARGHFTVKRLENKYGIEQVAKEYGEYKKLLFEVA